MSKLILILAGFLLLAQSVVGQAADKPTVALLLFGRTVTDTSIESAILDMLTIYEWLGDDERDNLAVGQDFAGEKLDIIFGDSGFDLTLVPAMVEEAIDKGADILVTFSTPVTQIAANITQDQDEPTPLLFTSVYSPYQAGLADAACLKPAHISGSESLPPYGEAFDLFMQQQPDMQRIGILYSTADAAGQHGAEILSELAAAAGINVESAAVTALSDLRSATQSLLDAGVEAFVLPFDYTVAIGLPIIVPAASQYQAPVFHPHPGAVLAGATIGAGFFNFYTQGIGTGVTLSALLNGDIDLASTAIDRFTGLSIGVNLDVAQELGIVLSPDLIDTADMIVRDGQGFNSTRGLLDLLDAMGADEGIKRMAASFVQNLDFIPISAQSDQPQTITALNRAIRQARQSPENMAADQAYLSALQCTDAMIAEQRAALNAAGE